MNEEKKPKITEILKSLQLIIEPGQVTELRALDVVSQNYRMPHTISGYFDDLDKLAGAAAQIPPAKGIYFVPNPVNPSLLARAANRLRAVGKEPTTSDTDIVARRWLLIDADPIRPAGISSSNAEHELALKKVQEIRDALSIKEWPRPLTGDSGNGGHLLYRIDLPANDDGLVQQCLEVLAFQFNDQQVTIDLKVFNPARIWKLYGTWACKGDSTTDRPHRLSRLLEFPDTQIVVTRELLEALAAEIPIPSLEVKIPSQGKSKGREPFDLKQWIVEHGLEVTGPIAWKDGQKWVFRVCPWNPDHTNRSAFIVRFGNGAIGAGCHHNSCQGRGWHELRDLIEPSWKEKRKKWEYQTKHSTPNADYHSPQTSQGETVNEEEIETKSWPDPMSEEAYHGLAGDIVRTLEPHTEADPAALLIQFLVGVGNEIGRTAHFIAEADYHYLNLFGVLVGISSKGRKGTSWGHIRRLLAAIDPEFKNRIPSGLSSGEGLIFAVRDPITKTVPRKDKLGKLTGEYDNVVEDEGVKDKRLLVYEGEYAQVLKMLSREGNTLSPVIRQAWDTGDLGSLTKNNRVKASNAHISIIGHITKDELCRYLTETECGNGFGNRFLWLCVKRSKSLPEGGKIQQVDFAPLIRRLNEVITFASQVGEMKRDENARALWIEVYPDLSEGKPGLLGAMTGRGEAQVMRLACIYALLDLSVVIRVEHLRAALAVWGYVLASCKFIFGDSLGDPEADELLSAIRSSPMGLSQKEILHEVFQRNKTSKQVGSILNILLESGLIRRKVQQPEGFSGGRPTAIYIALRL